MYAIVLNYQAFPELRMLDQAHQFVMTRMQQAVASLGIPANISGVSDLTLNGKKVSGNSMRCLKDRFLYHGTMICQEFDLTMVSKYLKRPVREPDYRAGRTHEDFLTRLPVDCETLKQAMLDHWDAKETLTSNQVDVLMRDAECLAMEKYSTDQWTRKVP